MDSDGSGTPENPRVIKALETWYLGHHFRSRLEARWASFFKHSDIDFQYEHQGYQLPDGTCYLPDFYLSKFHAWAEVKPVRFTEVERRKCMAVAAGLKELFLMLDGPPAFREYPGAGWDTNQVDIHAYSLDWRRGRSDRFFANNCQSTEADFSAEYQRAVKAALCERFDGSLPEPGKEPFNPAPGDILRAWGLL